MLLRTPTGLLISTCLALGGCAGADKSVAAADEPTVAPAEGDRDDDVPADEVDSEAEPVASAKGGIPTDCAQTVEDVCLPSRKWVNKLCMGDYPTVALALFQRGTPWKRGYVTRETKAWNASGGGSSPEKLKVDEEVLVLRKFSGQSPGGIQVSGSSGGYDALRWDGLCVTLDAAEIRFDAPAKPRNARIIWNRIEYDVREQLKKEQPLRKMYISFKQACRGVTVGKVSKDCEKLDGQLSETIAEWVRAHDDFPQPSKLPK